MSSCTTKPPDGQCAFFLSKKNRFCRFRPNKGQMYCAEHACVLGVELDRKRVVCPLNPKHTCYEDSLDKHLKKCNSRKRRTEVYYEEGINAGSDDGEPLSESQTAVKATDPEKLHKMIEKVNKLYEEHIGKLERDDRTHSCLKEELENPTYGLPALRHRRQQASLIGQLEGLGLLGPGHCYVEMGAGKGQLSHWVRRAVSDHDDAAFLLVDRSSVRYKVDGYHKEEETVQFERIKVDIEHLNLGKVPMISHSIRPLVAMGKHLCGAATDLTLRCLMQTLNKSDCHLDEPSPKRRREENSSEDARKSGKNGANITEINPLAHAAMSTVNSTGGGMEKGVNVAEEKTSLVEKDRDRAHLTRPSMADKDAKDTRQACESCGPSDGLHQLIEKDTGSAHQSLPPDECHPAGILIALCCHHQCTWRAYVGKQFMQQCGFSASDFNLLTRLTSWAVCGWRGRDGSFDEGGKQQHSSATAAASETKPVDVPEHDTRDLMTDADKKCSLKLSEKEKETVGWRCKRLLDYGRVCYLKDHGMRSSLKEYIDPSQTPENVVLVTVPST